MVSSPQPRDYWPENAEKHTFADHEHQGVQGLSPAFREVRPTVYDLILKPGQIRYTIAPTRID